MLKDSTPRAGGNFFTSVPAARASSSNSSISASPSCRNVSLFWPSKVRICTSLRPLEAEKYPCKYNDYPFGEGGQKQKEAEVRLRGNVAVKIEITYCYWSSSITILPRLCFCKDVYTILGRYVWNFLIIQI